MDQKRYLFRLSMAAHWMLPYQEAEEVTADYWELLDDANRADGAPAARFGRPLQAVSPLAGAHYRRWLVVFGLLALCLVLPVVFLFYWEHYPNAATVFMVAGMVLSLIWFRSRGGTAGRKRSKWLIAGILLLLLLSVAVIVPLLWLMTRPAQLLALAERNPYIGRIFTDLILLLGTLALAAGVAGLLKARLSDRRWAALYTLCLTVAVICAVTLAGMHGINMDPADENWWIPLVIRCAVTGLTGLAVTGVSLC